MKMRGNWDCLVTNKRLDLIYFVRIITGTDSTKYSYKRIWVIHPSKLKLINSPCKFPLDFLSIWKQAKKSVSSKTKIYSNMITQKLSRLLLIIKQTIIKPLRAEHHTHTCTVLFPSKTLRHPLERGPDSGGRSVDWSR